MPEAIKQAYRLLSAIRGELSPPLASAETTVGLIQRFSDLVSDHIHVAPWEGVPVEPLRKAFDELGEAAEHAHIGRPLDNRDKLLTVVDAAIEAVRLANTTLVLDDTPKDYVTLGQAAASVNRSKRTLERYVTDGRMPLPDIDGGGGRSNEWEWSKLRPWLEKTFGKILPERFFASRFR